MRLGPVHTNYAESCSHTRTEIAEAQYARIAPQLPVQRGDVSLSNQQVLDAILHVAEHGCTWRGLPAGFGQWHTIHIGMNRRSKNGVFDRVFGQLQREQIVRIKIEAVGQHERRRARREQPCIAGP